MVKCGTQLETVFDTYTIEEQIGQGANGRVFLAKNEDGNKCAIKIINRNDTNSEKLKRFKNEMSFCENVSHKNIIKILDHGTYNSEDYNYIFYVMPYYKYTLRSMMKTGIISEDVLPIFMQILNGLEFAHNKNVWHRDIKPENILIGSDNNLVIADFGIAHFCPEEKVTSIETSDHEKLANFTYAAPEQRTYMAADGRADIYAAGLILNEMFTGQVPQGTEYKLIGSVVKEYAFLDEIVRKMICQNSEDRIYPADRISSVILIKHKQYVDNLELQKKIENLDDDLETFQDINQPTISDIRFEDGELKLHLQGLKTQYYDKWFEILQNGSFSCTSLMGYGREKLRFSNGYIIMPIRNAEQNQSILSIANFIKEWIKDATPVFNTYMRDQERTKKENEKKEIEREVKRVETEELLNKQLNSF